MIIYQVLNKGITERIFIHKFDNGCCCFGWIFATSSRTRLSSHTGRSRWSDNYNYLDVGKVESLYQHQWICDNTKFSIDKSFHIFTFIRTINRSRRYSCFLKHLGQCLRMFNGSCIDEDFFVRKCLCTKPYHELINSSYIDSFTELLCIIISTQTPESSDIDPRWYMHYLKWGYEIISDSLEHRHTIVFMVKEIFHIITIAHYPRRCRS